MKALGATRVMVVIDPHLTESETAAIALAVAQGGGHRRRRVRPGAHGADRHLSQRGHRLRDRRRVRRLRGHRRRLHHRHGQGGRPLHHLSRRLPRVRQRAHRQGDARCPGRSSLWSPSPRPPAPAARPPGRPSSTSPRCAPRPASPTGRCGPGWASSTRTTPAPCRGWPSPARLWTSSATPSSRYTALPFEQREAPESPRLRPAYQGANPISSIWAAKALEIGAQVRGAGHGGPRRHRGAHQHDPGVHHRREWASGPPG